MGVPCRTEALELSQLLKTVGDRDQLFPPSGDALIFNVVSTKELVFIKSTR
jgi:hypothetical protein